MPLEYYIQTGGKRLRCGYTTGSCAALAAKAAASMLLTQQAKRTETIATPKGISVTADILDAAFGHTSASCAVRKDAGDDSDSTNGMLVYAQVSLTPGEGVTIEGGEGVGRVTRPGLEQPVGAAAINRVPREMITAEVLAVCEEYGYTGGMRVVVSIPGGGEAAAKTFNPRLGIAGGLSVLGTSGIVEPQSLQALVDTIEVEIKMLAAQGVTRLILTPGNYGEAFLAGCALPEDARQVKCSNFIGEALDSARAYGMKELWLIGHMGKLVKLAAGVMNTHSSCADARMEVFCAHAAMAGASAQTAHRLMRAITTDECVSILEEVGLREAVLQSLLERAAWHARRRAGENIRLELAMFSNQYGLLCYTPGLGALRLDVSGPC